MWNRVERRNKQKYWTLRGKCRFGEKAQEITQIQMRNRLPGRSRVHRAITFNVSSTAKQKEMLLKEPCTTPDQYKRLLNHTCPVTDFTRFSNATTLHPCSHTTGSHLYQLITGLHVFFPNGDPWFFCCCNVPSYHNFSSCSFPFLFPFYLWPSIRRNHTCRTEKRWVGTAEWDSTQPPPKPLFPMNLPRGPS